MRFPALLLISLLMLASCTGIPRGWTKARRTTPADGVSGAWIGTWHSETTGHSGGLRCVAEQRGPATWRFRYRASWAKVLCAGFTMDASVKADGKGGGAVSGSKDIGPLFGGTFSCEGTIRDGKFNARYFSKPDRGTMEMRRVSGG